MRHRFVLITALLASCSPQPSTTTQQSPAGVATTATADLPATSPAALAAKRTVERYFELIRRKKFAEARLMWDHGGADSGGDTAAFAASYTQFATYEPSVGDPTDIKVRDGIQYIAVGATAKVTAKNTGRVTTRSGPVLLRRTANATGAEQAWRIWGIDLRKTH